MNKKKRVDPGLYQDQCHGRTRQECADAFGISVGVFDQWRHKFTREEVYVTIKRKGSYTPKIKGKKIREIMAEFGVSRSTAKRWKIRIGNK